MEFCFDFLALKWVTAIPILADVYSKESRPKGRCERPDHGKGIWQNAGRPYDWNKQ
jgi:hypothetical protein